MGLLDQLSNLSPEQTQGLLAAASQFLQAGGPSRMPTSFGQALGGGIQGYQQGSAAYRKQKQDEEDAAQAAQFNGLKIQGLTGELADKETGRQQQLAAQKWLLNYNAQQSSPTAAAQSILGSSLAPTQENAALLKAQPTTAPSPQQSIYDRQLAQAQAMRNSGNPQLIAQADALEKSALAARPKYSTDFRTAMGPDGKLHNYVLNDNGEFKDTGLSVAPKIRELNLGGTTQLIDDNSATPGQVFKRTMTPGESSSAAQSAARLQFDKDQAAGNQDDVMDPLAIRLTAQQYLAGDTTALQNFGRGAQGAKNLNAVRLEITKQANAAGLNGADVAAKVAEFQGVKAGQRTAGTRSANIEIAANEAAQLAPLALEASAKVSRSGFLPFGKAQMMFNSNTNDPNLRQFAMANNALVNAFGQVMSRGGAATVSDKEHARELLSTAYDQPSYAAAVDQLQKEIEAARKAPGAVRKDLREAVSGRGESDQAAPAAATPSNQPHSKIIKIDGGGSATATLGADGKYYVQRGGKNYRVEE